MDDEIFNATPKLYKEYGNLGHAFGPVTRLRILDSLVKKPAESLKIPERQIGHRGRLMMTACRVESDSYACKKHLYLRRADRP